MVYYKKKITKYFWYIKSLQIFYYINNSFFIKLTKFKIYKYKDNKSNNKAWSLLLFIIHYFLLELHRFYRPHRVIVPVFSFTLHVFTIL